MQFKIHSTYKPSGDQPKAIAGLVDGLEKKNRFQTLLGVTGSGKTFTVANVIEQVQRPTLVIAHNKTLAAQLCNEFREFFPKNAVEYFVSYYDYYQPEAYMARTDTYIEKEAVINEEIDRLRHAATQAILTRRDVIIVASVSCIYGLGSPDNYQNSVLHIRRGESAARGEVMRKMVAMQFERTTADVTRGTFRAIGETVDVMPVNQEIIYRIRSKSGVVDEILLIDPITRKVQEAAPDVWIFPAKHYVTLEPERARAMAEIRAELETQIDKFEKEGKLVEVDRLERRTKYDLEMIQNIGFCNGIENYSRAFDGRQPGQPPYTLLNYFPKDFLTVIDESHVTVSQIGGMYEGDQARKRNLIDYGFRLPMAADNRPLRFEEFKERVGDVVFVSATPGPYERKTSSQVVEQIIRPTGLIDPEIIIRPVTGGTSPLTKGGKRGVNTQKSQVEDLIGEIRTRVKKHERVLVTTLTKKMAEDLTDYLTEKDKIAAKYLHSDVETIDRIRLLTEFRRGTFDVLIGVNLLREGLDLPEVTLVAILDADKEGFLRSETSLIQTSGRAARNVLGQVIMYADGITGSMKRAVDEMNRRRKIQIAYNEAHGITPKTIKKLIKDITEGLGRKKEQSLAAKTLSLEVKADPRPIEKVIAEKEKAMRQAAKELQFELAAVLRDEVKELHKRMTVPDKKSV